MKKPLKRIHELTYGGTLEGETQTWTHLLEIGKSQRGIFFLNPSLIGLVREKETPFFTTYENNFGFISICSNPHETLIYSRGETYKDLDELNETIVNPTGTVPTIFHSDQETIETGNRDRTDEKCLNFMFDVSAPNPLKPLALDVKAYIKSDPGDTIHITEPVIIAKYDLGTMGDSIHANGLITLEALGISDDVNYTSVIEDIAHDKVRIRVMANALNKPNLFVITDEWQALIKIKVTLPAVVDPGFLLNEYQMATLSRYFDLTEQVEQYFNCVKIESDLPSGGCSYPEITFIVLALLPNQTMSSGTDIPLVLLGDCFGDSLLSFVPGLSYVEFTNALEGPDPVEWVRPLQQDYFAFNNSTIGVWVPSVVDVVNGPQGYAGTGKVRVVTEDGNVTSAQPLQVEFSYRNAKYPNSDIPPNHTFPGPGTEVTLGSYTATNANLAGYVYEIFANGQTYWWPCNPYVPNRFAYTLYTFDGENEVCNPTGIQEPETNHLQIFPNPTSENLEIHSLQILHGAEVSILNALGEAVTSSTFSGYSVQISVSSLPTGLYLVSIKSNNLTETHKLIVE